MSTVTGPSTPSTYLAAVRTYKLTRMGNRTPLLLSGLFAASSLLAQPVFVNSSSLLPSITNSGGCVGVTDMNGDGRDDIATLHNSRQLVVMYQNADGTFSPFNFGAVSTAAQWGMALGDISNDGHKDLICGGSYDGMHYMRIAGPGLSTLGDLNNGSIYTQCVNMADIDNNGHCDYFSCHDDAAPRQWLNDGNGNLSYADIINYTTTPASDMSGNYGSVWTDFDNDGDLDLYIAKCRQGVNNPSDPRRWNRLFVNDGNGNYSDMAVVYGIQVRNQSWSADFGDIDNDGDMDLVITNHDATIQLFENDGAGFFTEITAGSGLEITGFFLQSIFRDFDNDGYLDLIVAGGINRYFKGNGDGTFVPFTNLFPSAKTMHSFGIGDLNSDGFLDVFSSYGDSYVTPDLNFPDRLWLNTPNGNHWFAVDLQGVVSNRDAIGARTAIYGPWGVQIREVRAGESYGIVNSFSQHFGLGAVTQVDSLVISWPSGQVDTYYNLPADQRIRVLEGVCIAPQASITTNGPAVVCTGGAPLTLEANPGFNYTWSNGASTQQTQVTTGGMYTVTIDDGNGCNAQASILVAQDPDVPPTVTVTGLPVFCDGATVTLTSSSATGNQWSTGETTPSIEVDATGIYTVSTMGFCGPLTSAGVEVTALSTPAAPTTTGATLIAPGTADLTATGTHVRWFDAYAGGNEVGSGNTWTTPFLTSTTSFWAEDAAIFGGGTANGGRMDSSSTGAYHNSSNFYLIFETFEDMIIRSVKVYANGNGNRDIALLDLTSGTTLQQITVNIPDGESRVTLDFDVPAGGPYGLRTTTNNPQLWRDGIGSNPAYPYALGTMGLITGTNVTGQNTYALYYFFYDWEVERPSVVCPGPRTEAQVLFSGVGVDERTTATGLSVWPNPADGRFTLTLPEASGATWFELLDITGRSVWSTQIAGTRERLEVDVQGLAAGEYVLRARHANGVATQRVVLR